GLAHGGVPGPLRRGLHFGRGVVVTRALRIAVSVALVGALLWVTDPGAAVARLRDADPGWLLAAAAMLTAQTVLMAVRWRLTAARLGLRIGFRRAVGEYYLGQAVNTTLPGGVVGDAARAVRTREAGLVRAAHAVMIERLAGQSALLCIASVGFAVALLLPGGPPWPAWTGLAVIAALAGAGLAGLAVRHVAPGFAAAARTALLTPSALIRHAALGFPIALLNLVAFAACARATGTVFPAEAVFTLIPLVLTAMLIPLSIAGWGWREGAAAALFPLIGAAPAAGVAAGLAFGLVLLAVSLPGLLWPILAPAGPGALTR
ncbi:MAG: lysylphosphatidylglycerol synthase transmembrane domain-containing protein, partial [Pseudomonadota bacterium]